MKLRNYLIALAAILALVSCGGNSQNTSSSQSINEASVQLSWFHDIEFVGFYEAERQDYFKTEGLNVAINAGGFDANGNFIDPVEKVTSKESDFGVTGAPQILRAREAGQPVVAIATIYQRNPVVLVSLGEDGILGPQDLVGKRVGTQPVTSTVGLTFEALVKSKGIQPDQFTALTDIQFGSVDPLFQNQVDAMEGFITNEAVQARLRSEDVNVMLLSDYGIDFYSNVVFTTEETIRERPEIVQAFLKSFLEGLDSALKDPEAAAIWAIDKYIEGATPDSEARQVQIQGMFNSVPLISPVDSNPGMMQPDVWEYAYEVLRDSGLLTTEVDVKAAYTLDFLNSFYSG